MKLMFASDLHGSLFFCEKLMREFEKEKPDKPRNNLTKNYDTQKVAELLNSIKNYIICVRGNCDSEVDQAILNFEIRADYINMYLENRLIFLTHGHIYNKNHLPFLNSGDIIIHGHTHIPTIEKIGEIIYINPGSVSLPRNNSQNSFMLYYNREFKIKDFDGKIITRLKI